MNKIIIYLVALIILAIAGEGGYYLGVNAGKRIGVQETLRRQNQRQTQEKPSSIIPVIGQSASQWIEHVNSLPIESIWNSNWQVSIGGKFVSMNDKSIILEINGEKKTINFPMEISRIEKVQFSQYNIETQIYTPNSLSQNEIVPGDLINVSITVGTLTGKVSFLEISKQLGQKLFN